MSDYNIINASGVASVNYAIIVVAGTLTITAVPSPPVLIFSVTNKKTALLSWNAASNVSYRIQYKFDLGAINWTDLPGDVLATGSTAFKSDAITASNRFYRITVLP